MFITPSGIIILVRLEHLLNIPEEMFVNPSDRVTLVRLLQPAKIWEPTVLMVLGILIIIGLSSALLADYTITPALLHVAKPFGKEKEEA